MRARLLAAAVVLVLASAALFWTAGAIRALDNGDPRGVWYQRHYEYLTEGFARGRLSLSLEPDPALGRLADPYDPAQNLPWRLWDASLYRGRYYLYFGPTPAVLLMLPVRLATGWLMPQWLAVALFSCAALAGLLLLVAEIAGRCFPRVRPWQLGVTLAGAAAATWIPVTIRWPSVWSLPVVAACACLWWSLYFLWRLRLSGRVIPWAILSGLGLGLLLGARATYLFAVAGVLALHWAGRSPSPEASGQQGRQREARAGAGLRGVAGRRRSVRPWTGARPVLAAGALVALAGLALLAYNRARFGSPWEFGQSYQLWGDEERHLRHFNPAFIPFNARLYFLSRPQLSPYFPFALGTWPDSLPTGYMQVQEIHGILFALPVHLAGLAALVWALRRRPDEALRPLRRVLLASALVAACSTGLLLAWAGATTRYITEMVSGWTPLTAVGLLLIFSAPASRTSRAVKAAAVAACLWSVLYTGCASASYMGFFHRTSPAAFDALAHVLDRPADELAALTGRTFGPLELTVGLAPFTGPGSAVLAVSGRPGRLEELLLRRVDAGHVRLMLAENDQPTLVTGVLPCAAGALRVRIEAPWLYPPPASPYWDRAPQSGARASLLGREAITVDGATTAGPVAHSYDAASFAPLLVTRALDPSATAWVTP